MPQADLPILESKSVFLSFSISKTVVGNGDPAFTSFVNCFISYGNLEQEAKLLMHHVKT